MIILWLILSDNRTLVLDAPAETISRMSHRTPLRSVCDLLCLRMLPLGSGKLLMTHSFLFFLCFSFSRPPHLPYVTPSLEGEVCHLKVMRVGSCGGNAFNWCHMQDDRV